jgi:hypothetical protein
VEAVKIRVERAIKALTGDVPADISLEDVPPDKVAGEVVSDAFRGILPSDRQIRLWDELDKVLDTYERTRIVLIMTLTPHEKRVLTESD